MIKKQGNPTYLNEKLTKEVIKKNRHVFFNYKTHTAKIKDLRKKKEETKPIGNVQDMLSLFYFLRNQDVSNIKKGDDIDVDMFIDSETTKFKLRFLGIQYLKSRFGKVKTLKFRPIVQSGRVFKAKESVTIWITADANKIPIKIEADLSVGSVKIELDAYKGLANPFEVIYD